MITKQLIVKDVKQSDSGLNLGLMPTLTSR
jgi:hypothetical protein